MTPRQAAQVERDFRKLSPLEQSRIFCSVFDTMGVPYQNQIFCDLLQARFGVYGVSRDSTHILKLNEKIADLEARLIEARKDKEDIPGG